MQLDAVAKQLNLPKPEIAKRAAAIGANIQNLTENDVERIRGYAPMTVSQSKPEPPRSEKPKPTAKSGTLKERFEETETAAEASATGRRHLNDQLFEQRYHDGRAVGQLSSMAYIQGVSEGSLEMDYKLLGDFISEEQGQIAELAATKFGLGKPIQQIYSEATEIKALAMDLSI